MTEQDKNTERTLGEILGEMKGISKSIETHTEAIKDLYIKYGSQQSYIDQNKGAAKVWGIISGAVSSAVLGFISWRINGKF